MEESIKETRTGGEERNAVSVEEEDGGAGSPVAGRRMLAAWEIASVVSSFLIAEWMIVPFAENNKLLQAIPIGLALLLMLLSHRERGETAREIGWRFDNFGAAARLLALPMLAGALVIVGAGLYMRSLRLEREQFWQWALWLPLWGLMQQYVLQGFINRRAELLCGRNTRSLLLVALVFALLHLPNPWLSVATFIGGFIWAAVYQRAPNLPALALSHGLMSLLLASSLPPAMLNSLRVGFKYFG
ncbi:MAG TPA: CPBP family glutamic-type intramembrane protease [Pyrinomonadaceae bacterium]